MSRSARGKPILVTGAHRSGTTWVGKMLALAPGVGYVHEPFSPATGPGISGAPFDRYFTYVTAENEALYEPGVARSLSFRYDVLGELRSHRSPRDVLYASRDWAAFARARATHARPLVKDPIALLSAEWLAERFSMEVVVTVRHPAGFASSLQRLGWTHRFAGFLEDERLMGDHLGPFEDEIRAQAAEPSDVLGQAILLWRICYSVADGYRQRHPDWTFVRHEDVSREPLSSFERLYARLGLALTDRARREIERSSAATNPPVAHSKHGFHVNSRANVSGWRGRLSAADIERIRTGTGDVWPLYYSDDDW